MTPRAAFAKVLIPIDPRARTCGLAAALPVLVAMVVVKLVKFPTTRSSNMFSDDLFGPALAKF